MVLTPEKEGYAFSPAKTTLRNVTANQEFNFTAADTLAPVVKALAQSVTNGQNKSAKVQSNEGNGFVYVVKETENPQNVTEIAALITVQKAAKTGSCRR